MRRKGISGPVRARVKHRSLHATGCKDVTVVSIVLLALVLWRRGMPAMEVRRIRPTPPSFPGRSSGFLGLFQLW
jgi:hypothetical protein